MILHCSIYNTWKKVIFKVLNRGDDKIWTQIFVAKIPNKWYIFFFLPDVFLAHLCSLCNAFMLKMFYKYLLWWTLCLEWFQDFQNFQSFSSRLTEKLWVAVKLFLVIVSSFNYFCSRLVVCFAAVWDRPIRSQAKKFQPSQAYKLLINY